MAAKVTAFIPSVDNSPKYTVKEFAEKTGLSTYTVRYYDNSGLIPGVTRTGSNIRMFSEHSKSWVLLVNCLRSTGLSIEEIKHYIDLCRIGDSTIPERAKIIFAQESVLDKQIADLQEQKAILEYKKNYYKKLLASGHDPCNPANYVSVEREAAKVVGE